MHLGAEVAERKKYFQTIGIGIWHRRSVPYQYSQQEIKVPHTQYGGGGGGGWAGGWTWSGAL